MRWICDGILLGQKPAKATTAYDHATLRPDEMSSQPFNVLHDLVERVRRRMGALAVAAEVEGQNARCVGQRRISHKVGFVVPWNV